MVTKISRMFAAYKIIPCFFVERGNVMPISLDLVGYKGENFLRGAFCKEEVCA